ncbi:MAG TPA: hypothetical protein VGE52_19920 [Pirellulales bacterium]
MALSPQAHLDLVDEVIEKRLRGDAYTSYSEAGQQFVGTPIETLYEIRTKLQQEVAGTSAGGGSFRRVVAPNR